MHGDCIRGISASRESGLLDAFTHLEMMLIPVNDDPGEAEIHFHWCANPSKTGINVSAFVRRIRKMQFAPLQEFSDTLLAKAGMDAEFLDSATIPRHDRNWIDFGSGRTCPAFQFLLAYWRRPPAISTKDYLGMADREKLAARLRRQLDALGLSTWTSDPDYLLENEATESGWQFYLVDLPISSMLPCKKAKASIAVRHNCVQLDLTLAYENAAISTAGNRRNQKSAWKAFRIGFRSLLDGYDVEADSGLDDASSDATSQHTEFSIQEVERAVAFLKDWQRLCR